MSDSPTSDGEFDPGRLRTAPTQMRRSRDDRYIAGVCGGLARYLNVDPVVIRVIMAALAVVGGVGFVLYGAAWLLAPEEGADQSVLESHLPDNPRVRTLGWIVAGVVAVGAVVGSGPWFGWRWIGPFPLLGLAVLVWVLARPRTAPPAPAAPAPPAATPPQRPTAAAPTASAAAPVASTDALHTEQLAESTGHDVPTGAASDDRSPTDQPPTGETPTAFVPPLPPPTARRPPAPPPGPPARPARGRPRGSGMLSWLTLALFVTAIGGLWLADQAGADIDGPVYLASGLGVVTAGILVGVWWGNGRWLIPFGAVLTVALLVVSQLPTWKFGKLDEVPTTAGNVRSSYSMGAGQINLDLTQVADLAALDGRTISIENGLGETRVWVPHGLDVTVVADVNGGNIDLFGQEADGADASKRYSDSDDADPNLRIEIEESFGHVEVTRA